MEEYCLYLRKSRADEQFGDATEIETLARHEKILLDLARRMHLNVTEIYREVVSGETITSRPVVQELLREVEACRWSGVLVVEIERLARGDTIDQGIVARAFKYSGTRIITPTKVYEPDNEYDQEYFEFGLFMSRREYNTIRRRLERGKVSAAKEGKHVVGVAPYGYKKIPVASGKGYTLVPIEPEADVVRLMFKLYTEGERLDDGSVRKLGTAAIAARIEKLGFKSPHGTNRWSQRTVGWILTNPVYVGKIRYQHKISQKYVVDGVVKKRRVTSPENEIIVSGLHEGLVSEKVFDLAQEIAANRAAASVPTDKTLANPLSGIVFCALCGYPLRYKQADKTRKASEPSLYCRTRGCPTIGSYLPIVEQRVIDALRVWVSGYSIDWSKPPAEEKPLSDLKKDAYDAANNELKKLRSQLDRTYDLLEQGVYDADKFLERSSVLSARINEVTDALSALQEDIDREKMRESSRRDLIPKAQHLLDVYWDLPSATAKNEMLREILERVDYSKSKRGKRNGPNDDFKLKLFPKLPKA